MAVSTTVKSQLQLVLEVGFDEAGDMILKNKNFNNIKTDSTADQLFAIASALQPLQQHVLHSIERNDSEVIVS